MIAFSVFGFLIAIVVFCIRRAGRVKVVSAVSMAPDTLYDILYERLSGGGRIIEESEPLEARRMDVSIENPHPARFLCIGLLLFMSGIFPGVVWFIYGKDRLTITIKRTGSTILLIVEMNSRYSQKVWQKINLRLTREMLGSGPQGLENSVEVS